MTGGLPTVKLMLPASVTYLTPRPCGLRWTLLAIGSDRGYR
ncbi:hypothetical protein NQK81_01820 [Amycolatopsis roodepoortensis]|nr:hypothetical protein [Amycolatopsis roodepoortensis]UUV32212.1 hypothetical protein NQK81_01820 [Amycolatopsis roodepoortensis]